MKHWIGRTAYRVYQLISVLIAVTVFLVAFPALLDWILDAEVKSLLVPDHVTMKANTAAGFIIGALLLLVARLRHTWFQALVRWSLASVLFLLAGLTLLQYLVGIDLRVDQWLATAPEDEMLTSAPGRMSPTTAIGFMVFAAAIAADHWHSELGRKTSRVLAMAVLMVALTSMLGYLYGVPTLYLGIDGVTAMALSSAGLFAGLALGVVWLHPQHGTPALLVEASVTGTHIRAMLPMIFVTPVLVGGAVIYGYGRWYEGELAVALTSIGSVLATAIIALVSVEVLRRAENESNLRDRAIAAATNGMFILDNAEENLPIVFTNHSFSEITGYAFEEVYGKSSRFLYEGMDNPASTMQALDACLFRHIDCVTELKIRHRNGTAVWSRLSMAPVFDHTQSVSHFVGVIDNISVLKHQEQLLRKALDDARAASEARDVFVRLISHELRTPLNAAQTWLQLMEVDDSPDTRQRGLAVMDQSIRTQARLIDDLVDVTRFRSVGVNLDLQAVDVRDLLEVTIDELRPAIEKQHQLELDIDPGDFTARLDPVRFQQIVRNLVGNSAKYMDAGGHIQVRLDSDETGIVLEVADRGIGLNEEQVGRVFEPFWRADSDKPGIGVGLFITESLVKAHGGQIEVFSEGQGHGTRFRVTLPVGATASTQTDGQATP